MKYTTFIKMNNVLKPHGRNFMKAIHSLMIRQVREKKYTSDFRREDARTGRVTEETCWLSVPYHL